jgi:hypothetical protein
MPSLPQGAPPRNSPDECRQLEGIKMAVFYLGPHAFHHERRPGGVAVDVPVALQVKLGASCQTRRFMSNSPSMTVATKAPNSS